ncbi:unnamed protein product, partial [Prorocentrum cordatum]
RRSPRACCSPASSGCCATSTCDWSTDRPITPQQYLENALAPIAGQEKRNEIRAVIKSVFTDRDCAAMVRPVLEEEDLRHVERLPFASLRPQFRKQVDEFTQRVYAAVRPKMIDGAVDSKTS